VNMEHTANIEVKSAPTITHFLKFLGIYYWNFRPLCDYISVSSFVCLFVCFLVCSCPVTWQPTAFLMVQEPQDARHISNKLNRTDILGMNGSKYQTNFLFLLTNCCFISSWFSNFGLNLRHSGMKEGKILVLACLVYWKYLGYLRSFHSSDEVLISL
jgi:hypothetical protein